MKHFSSIFLCSLILCGLFQTGMAQTISINDARNTANGDTVTVKGIVTQAQGRQVYIQDATAGILIFQSSGVFKDSLDAGYIRAGDSLEIEGELTEFSGLKQFNPVISFSVSARDNKLPAYQVVSLSELIANGEAYESERIRVLGLSFSTPQSGNWANGTTYPVTDGVDVLDLRTPSGSDSPLISNTPIPNDPFVFEGVLGTFGGVYQLTPWVPEDAYEPYGLSLFHNNDAESDILGASDTAGTQDFGGAAFFKTLIDMKRSESATAGNAVLTLSSGDNFLAGKEFNASLNRDPSLPFYDAVVIDSIGYDALCIGNHEFDFGPSVLADLIEDVSGTMPPFLSANLDVSQEPDLQALVTAGRIAPRTLLMKNGEMIGVVGATTPNLPFISSPGGVVVEPSVAAVITAEIDSLKAAGANKIVLISHLQGVEEDTALARALNDVDIIIAGGGDELLANPSDVLVPGDNADGPYPLKVTDADGDTVYVVTTAGQFKYLGNFNAQFSARGEIISYDGGAIRVSAIAPDAVTANQGIQDNVVDSLLLYIANLSSNIIANTQVAIDGRRSTVRAREGNEGNLVADAFLWQARALADQFDVPKPVAAIVNGGGIRNDEIIAAGTDISEAKTFDISPFGNVVSVVEDIDVVLLKQIVENCVSRVDTGSGTGRFGNYAGMKIVYDTLGTRQLITNGVVTQVGTRVKTITLDDGTPMVKNGSIVAGAPTIALALPNFLAVGGDQYPTANQALTLLGVTDQVALANYLAGPLEGLITADNYPEGGNGRIFRRPFDPDSVLTVEQARLFPDGDTVTFQGVITRAKGRISSLQEGSFGIGTFTFSGAYRDSVEAGSLVKGDKVQIKGERNDFNFSQEINPIVSFSKISSGNVLPAYQTIAVSDLIGLNGEKYENELVRLSGLQVANNPGGNWTANASFDVFSLENDTIELRTPGATDTDIATQAIPAGLFIFEGVINNRFDNFRPFPIDSTDIRGGSVFTILHNNDAESQIIDAGSGEEEFGGAARFKTLVDNLKSEALNLGRPSLMLSSGDNFLAGPEFSASINRDPSLPYYDAVVVDSIGYDALCIGNHEFDFGPEVLANFIEDVSESMPPFLSANLDVSGETSLDALATAGRIASRVVVDKNGEQIGIVGATTPNLPFISSPGAVVVDQNVAASVQAEVDALTGQGVDKIILISHLQDLGEDSVLASQVRGVDVMIAGGGDELLANDDDLLIPGDTPDGAYPRIFQDADGETVYAVTTPGEFKYVGQLVIEFDEAGKVSLIDDGSGPIRVSTIGADAVMADNGVQTQVVDSLEEALSGLDANILAFTEVALDGVRNNVRSVETNQGNLIADAFLWQANQLAADFGAPQATIAMGNGGGIRNDEVIPANSNISERKTFEILPFANFITIVEDLSPEEFKLLMENAVSRINTNSGGTGRFAQIAGFTIDYDTTRAPAEIDVDGTVINAGDRICEIMLEDSTLIVSGANVVDGAPNVNLATVDFLARGGDQYPLGGKTSTILGVTYQIALANYLTESLGGTVTAADYPEGGEGRTEIVEGCAITSIDGLVDPFKFVAYPNPVKDQATLSYTLDKVGQVSMQVLNPLGQPIQTLLDEEMKLSGEHELELPVGQLSAGVYTIRLTVDGISSLKRLIIF